MENSLLLNIILLFSMTIFNIETKRSGASTNNTGNLVQDPNVNVDPSSQNPVIPLPPVITKDPQYKRLLAWIKNNPKMTALISAGVITAAGIVSLMIEAAINKEDSIAVKIGDRIKKIGIDVSMVPDAFKLARLQEEEKTLKLLSEKNYFSLSSDSELRAVAQLGYNAGLLSFGDSVMFAINKTQVNEKIEKLKKNVQEKLESISDEISEVEKKIGDKQKKKGAIDEERKMKIDQQKANDDEGNDTNDWDSDLINTKDFPTADSSNRHKASLIDQNNEFSSIIQPTNMDTPYVTEYVNPIA